MEAKTFIGVFEFQKFKKSAIVFGQCLKPASFSASTAAAAQTQYAQ